MPAPIAQLLGRWTLQKLRPPSKRKLFLAQPFSAATPPCLGHVYRLDMGEPAIAAGGGTVRSIRSLFPGWPFTPGSPIGTQRTYEVVLDHGNGITTSVHGLASV